MGRPFANELKVLPDTIDWARSLDLQELSETIDRYHHPVYIVGSGGSFSACVYAADLLTSKGIFAKAVTPLELFYSGSTIKKSNLIFISASGRNTDILFAFKNAIEREPISIINICMQKKTKLSSLSAAYSSCTNYEFDPPAGKDGFLATNSLAAYFVILYRAITNQSIRKKPPYRKKIFWEDFLNRATSNTSFIILYGAYHHAVAVDLESKFSEAGLAPSLLSDYRHFAHGRHHWFDKRKDSAIIALTCPADYKLCLKTLALLPSSIPQMIMDSSTNNFEGTIYLLLQGMELISRYGKIQSIDPGRPGVPKYGSKIYHLNYERLLDVKPLEDSEIAIVRKSKITSITDLKPSSLQQWQVHYSNFMQKLSAAKFGSLIFDYDGTLCAPANRFNGMGKEISTAVINYVKKGFVLGIISGRGQSLRKDMERVFGEQPLLMKNVILGYYNGSDIAPLSNSKHPQKIGPMQTSLHSFKIHLATLGIKADESPNQLTFGSKTTKEWGSLRDTLLNELMLLDLPDLTVVESSHSIDIIPRKLASKNHIIEHCRKLCKSLNLAEEVLCIGDKGQWPGNDYALLANEFALSVGEVSSLPQTGWNISPAGLRDEKAVYDIFGRLRITKNYFKFQIL